MLDFRGTVNGRCLSEFLGDRLIIGSGKDHVPDIKRTRKQDCPDCIYQMQLIDQDKSRDHSSTEKHGNEKNNIEEILSDDTIDGAVVTHGTDTLDETAYFLTLTLNTPKPVVLTGAMRPATATSADGPFNLYQAICLACHGESYNRGVLALFSNTIYSGRDIEKVNNFKIDAFDQRSLGCLGYMQDQEVYFYTQTSKIHTIKSRFNKRIDSIKSVAIAFYYSGADAKILYDLASNHEGIVIAGSGSGNYSQAWLKAIEELSEKGTIFVRSSRISQGIVFDDEIFDPHRLCISSNNLTKQKARVLLMLALTQTHDRDEIREIFLQY